MEESASGEEQEFAELFNMEYSYVSRSLRRLGVLDSDVEDLAQEVFVSAHRSFARYDRTRPRRPWLFGYVFRVAANYRRLARHRRESQDAPRQEPSSCETPETVLVARQRRELLLDALEGVPFERRSALVLADIDGFEASEIARVLCIPINTVYSRVRVAREELRRSIHRLQLQRGES